MYNLFRYLLDNPKVSAGKKVLDLGSGCGASAISAKVSGAAYVVANDIDPGDAFIHMSKIPYILHNVLCNVSYPIFCIGKFFII